MEHVQVEPCDDDWPRLPRSTPLTTAIARSAPANPFAMRTIMQPRAPCSLSSGPISIRQVLGTVGFVVSHVEDVRGAPTKCADELN